MCDWRFVTAMCTQISWAILAFLITHTHIHTNTHLKLNKLPSYVWMRFEIINVSNSDIMAQMITAIGLYIAVKTFDQRFYFWTIGLIAYSWTEVSGTLMRTHTNIQICTGGFWRRRMCNLSNWHLGVIHNHWMQTLKKNNRTERKNVARQRMYAII